MVILTEVPAKRGFSSGRVMEIGVRAGHLKGLQGKRCPLRLSARGFWAYWLYSGHSNLFPEGFESQFYGSSSGDEHTQLLQPVTLGHT